MFLAVALAISLKFCRLSVIHPSVPNCTVTSRRAAPSLQPLALHPQQGCCQPSTGSSPRRKHISVTSRMVLPAKIGHHNVAALVERHRHRQLLRTSKPVWLGFSDGSLVRLPREKSTGVKSSSDAAFVQLPPFVRRLHQLRTQRHVARHVQIRQHLFGNALEHRRGHLPPSCRPTGESSETRIVTAGLLIGANPVNEAINCVGE